MKDIICVKNISQIIYNNILRDRSHLFRLTKRIFSVSKIQNPPTPTDDYCYWIFT